MITQSQKFTYFLKMLHLDDDEGGEERLMHHVSYHLSIASRALTRIAHNVEGLPGSASSILCFVNSLMESSQELHNIDTNITSFYI